MIPLTRGSYSNQIHWDREKGGCQGWTGKKDWGLFYKMKNFGDGWW